MPASSRWERIEALFDEALRQPRGERRAWLVRACPDDELRLEVEGMVGAHEKTEGVLERQLAALSQHVSEERPTEALPSGLKAAVRQPTVGPYRLLRQVGQGGMGIVYQAYDPRLDRHVALKFLPQPYPSDTSHLAKRFLAEAKAASALDHPNICTIYDVGETEEGQLYIAMAYYEGETLAERIARGPIGVDESIELVLQAAHGLARAHEAGIIHRDVKPANLMLTDRLDGPPGRERPDRLKVLDFGIAKLEGGSLTRTGATPGTLAYMSPEQLDGAAADPRSDLWSLGVVLYEMLTGELPFHGHRGALTRAILFEQPRSLRGLRPDVPPSLDRVVAKVLSKVPEERHSSAAELVLDLEAVQRESELPQIPPASGSRAASLRRGWRRRRWQTAALASALALTVSVLTGTWLGWRRGDRPDLRRELPGLAPPRASVAVLYFDNLSGDPALDWLRHGLSDLLVTDLSQSPELRVLATDRLYQVLDELDRLEEPVTSSDLVQAVVERTGVDTVVLGSFARLGETIRISIKVREAASGVVRTSEKADAHGEAELFAQVDELSRQVRLTFELPPEPETVVDRDLTEVTTTSIEAYRYYVEAEKLLRQQKNQEAIALFEKALEADGGFAMAMVRLSEAHQNLMHDDLEAEYVRRALEHEDRLSGPERAQVEALTSGVESLRRSVELYPHMDSLRRGLARRLIGLREFDEAIEHLELLRKEGPNDPRIYHDLATAHSRRGDLDRAFQVLEECLRRFPDSFGTYYELAEVLATRGQLDEAEAALAEIEALRPGYVPARLLLWDIKVLREEWDKAEELADELGNLDEPWAQERRLACLATLRLYHGRSSEAAEIWDRLPDTHPEPGTARAFAHVSAALQLLKLGRNERALEHARAAERGDDSGLSLNALTAQALALLRLGRDGEADLTTAELARRTEGSRGQRRALYHLVKGRIASARGDVGQAIAELETRESLLGNDPCTNFYLASEYLSSGQADRAAEYFRSMVEGTDPSRTMCVLSYVRSFYFLGLIHEQGGDDERARAYYRRFVGFWGDGELDRGQVEHARQFLDSPHQMPGR